MPSPSMLMHLALDFFSRQQQARVPEPELIMADAMQADAFTRAGRENGILAHTYVYHALQISALIKPGDTVLDLGCGPANQLVQIARLNPAANFIGIDASQKMLDLAHDNVIRCGVSNVAFQQGHMERLGQFSDVSIDGVISTMSLHHLPDMAALRATCYEVRRILKPDGALYFADFGRLKRMATQRFFAEDRKSTQPAIFTVDYFNSLRAAFSLRDLTEASHVLGDRVKIHKTFLVPFLVVAKTGQRHTLEIEKRAAARSMYAALTPRQKYDLRDLSRFFRHGGLPLPFKPWQTTLHAIEPALQ